VEHLGGRCRGVGMSLRVRVLALTGLAFAALVGGSYGTLRAITLDRFGALEKREVRRDIERATGSLQRDIDAIETICADWAQWDDAYRFMVENSREFVEANLSLASLANLGLDALLFTTSSGEVRHAVALDAERSALVAVPPSLLPALAEARVLGLGVANPRRTGLIALPEGVMMVAARAILTSKLEGPSRGTLVMGRYITPDSIRALGAGLRLTLDATPVSSLAGLPATVDLDAVLASPEPVVVPAGRDLVQGFAVLRDLGGRPALLLRVDEPRDVFRQGVATTCDLLLALVLATCLVAGLVLLLLEHSVLAPLARLGSALGQIAAQGTPNGRVPVQGQDEIATLARQINAMLEALEANREELRASEARFRHLVETAPDVIFTVIGRPGRIASLSPAFERLTGWRAEQWLGHKALRLVAPGDRKRVLQAARAIGEGGHGGSFDVRVRTAAGEFIDCDVAATRETVGGRLVGLLGVARDITIRKRLEAEVVHAQKMQAIGMLTGGIAHDFNNLLQAQMSLVQLLRFRRKDPTRQDRIIGDLEALIRRGAALTRQLLVFARKDVSKREELELGDVLRDGVLLAQRLVRENVQVDAAIEGGRMPILGDRAQLGQVLLNLVTNAADAMPDGGRIRLCAGRRGEREAYVEVADSGAGISDEVKARMFEPFFTTKEAGRGTGLGLAVVDSIVSAHGGRVEVESEPGRGSTFRVVLPLGESAAATPAASATGPPLPDTGRGERILLVEDEDGAREALRETLASLGYDVLAVESAERAGLVPAEPEFDLLLTDQMLPGAAGIDLATGLVDRWPALAVIVMSGYSEGQVLHRAVHRREVRFLPKPFDLATLAREVRAALDARQAARQADS